MLSAEFSQFETQIRTLESVYGKAIDDATIQAYWHSLRDLSLDVLKRRIEEHIKRGKFFPKPAELRPKDTTPVVEQDERSRREFEASDAVTQRQWEEHLQRDPQAKWRLWAAYVARITIAEHPSTTFYAERMRFARDAGNRLIAELGFEGVLGDTHIQHAISVCLGAECYKRVIDMAHDRRLKAAA